MTSQEQEVAKFLYMSKELQLAMNYDDYLFVMQQLLDTGNIWQYSQVIFSRVQGLLDSGELPYHGKLIFDEVEEIS